MLERTTDFILLHNWIDHWNISIYAGCNRRNGPDFGRVFLRSYYTDI